MSDPAPSATPNPRTIPMQILCLGMCRTGTQSLATALSLLCYAPIYHMREVKKSGHESFWIRALELKYAPNSPSTLISREKFDEVLGNWASVTDVPACLFPSDLMDAYPNAKVILTTRELEKWFESMKSTIWAAPVVSELGKRVYELVWGGNEERFGRERLLAHDENVRKAAKDKGQEILEGRVQEGWERLCGFLGKEVPTEDGKVMEFPREDDWAKFGWKKTA